MTPQLHTPTVAPVAVTEFRLPQIMKEKGLTVNVVAKQTGLTPQAIYQLLKAVPRQIHLDTITRLCLGLDVQPSDLFIVRRPRPKGL